LEPQNSYNTRTADGILGSGPAAGLIPPSAAALLVMPVTSAPEPETAAATRHPRRGAPANVGLVRPLLLVRSLVGGILMGLANLVPGISGGTMLLAVGIYPDFIRGVAEVTTLTFRRRTLLILACVAGAGFLAIATLAGPVGRLVVDHRWIMYSLFIGLTLGGAPVLWRMLRPLDGAVAVTSAAGVTAMAALALADPGSLSTSAGGIHAVFLLILAGAAGGSAMVLPGVSGGYLLLVLGQYLTILAAVDQVRGSLTAGDWLGLAEALKVFIPVGIGVAIGVVGVSNLLKRLLDRHERPTLGVLLGLLLGAVFGLWPFQRSVAPQIGEVIRGITLTNQEMVAEVAAKDYPTAFFAPSPGQVLAALVLIGAGFAASSAVARLGRKP